MRSFFSLNAATIFAFRQSSDLIKHVWVVKGLKALKGEVLLTFWEGLLRCSWKSWELGVVV